MIYVDDILATFETKADETSFKQALFNRFPVGAYETAKWHLGINVTQTQNEIQLRQLPSIEEAIRKYGLIDALTSKTPTSSQHLEPKEEHEKELDVTTPYRGIVGTSLYISEMTRPDTSLAVNQVSKYVSNPTRRHWNAAKRILKYLKKTKNLGLIFKRQGNQRLIGYTDADFANDTEKRRSVSGFVFTLNGTPISWKSRLQRTTALSTCEAELEALFLCAKEALYLRKLVQDFGYQQQATTIFCDNKSAIIVANNPSSGKRTKHLSVKYHFLKDCLEAGFIEIKHISSEENIADIFTKPIVGEKFLGLRNKLLTEKLD